MEISVFLSFLLFYWWNLKRVSLVTFDRLAACLFCCIIRTFVMRVLCIALMLFRRESACSNCIILEPTDVVVVGTSQTFAEMFLLIYLHNLLSCF